MIVGVNNRGNDLVVNPTKAKQLTNIRASGKDDAIKLPPAKIMTLEQSLSYIQSDELVEVTPSFSSINLHRLGRRGSQAHSRDRP